MFISAISSPFVFGYAVCFRSAGLVVSRARRADRSISQLWSCDEAICISLQPPLCVCRWSFRWLESLGLAHFTTKSEGAPMSEYTRVLRIYNDLFMEMWTAGIAGKWSVWRIKIQQAPPCFGGPLRQAGGSLLLARYNYCPWWSYLLARAVAAGFANPRLVNAGTVAVVRL